MYPKTTFEALAPKKKRKNKRLTSQADLKLELQLNYVCIFKKRQKANYKTQSREVLTLKTQSQNSFKGLNPSTIM